MCVSAFERGFEPSSSKLMWGEVKHNPAAGPAPHETADPVLNESQPFEVERGCCLGPIGDCTETLPSQSFTGGVFCEVELRHRGLFLRRLCDSPSAISLCVAAVWLPSDIPSATSALFRLVSALRLFIPEDACCFLTPRESKLLNRRVQRAGGT